jgi:hypothetical protein
VYIPRINIRQDFFCIAKKKGYIEGVAGKRAEGQRQVIVWMKEELIDMIDQNLEGMGFSDRARFIRAAIVDKLESGGSDAAPDLALAPMRVGKGGRPRKGKTGVDTAASNDGGGSRAAEEPDGNYGAASRAARAAAGAGAKTKRKKRHHDDDDICPAAR